MSAELRLRRRERRKRLVDRSVDRAGRTARFFRRSSESLADAALDSWPSTFPIEVYPDQLRAAAIAKTRKPLVIPSALWLFLAKMIVRALLVAWKEHLAGTLGFDFLAAVEGGQ